MVGHSSIPIIIACGHGTTGLWGTRCRHVELGILIDALSDKGIKVIEGDFNYLELKTATSAWLTSSTKGIAPIENIVNIDHSLSLDDSLYISCKEIFDSKFFG